MIERMTNFLPDLIITDNFVEQKVAAEIIKEIRSQYFFSTIPVILFSGHPDIEKLSKEINANAHLSKPFTIQELNSCIDKVSAELSTGIM
jgi:two-component SAPR family response regulator